MFLHLGSPPEGPPPPFAAWSSRQLKVLDKAIALAWGQTMATSRGRTLLASGNEAEITSMLQDAITYLLGSETLRGFSPAVFGAPIRGQELEDYSGTRLEKRPDLTIIRLSARPAINHNAMFYECKILGRGRTVDDYITHGVMRFQNGNYAWAMPHAGMIGYVAAGHRTDAKASLIERWTHTKSHAPCAPLYGMVEDHSMNPVIAISIHARTFMLRNGEAPGNIMLRHMWLGEPPASVTP